MTKTKTTVDLFAAPAVKVAAVKTAKDKVIIARPDLAERVQTFNRLKDEISSKTAQLKMLEGDIKTVGREVFMDLYAKHKIRPDSFKIADITGANVLFIAMDKYTAVDETKADILSAYDDLLEEKKTFVINAELIDKYGAVISRLIMGCKEIEDEDKTQLIQGTKQYSVAKGAIERLMQYDCPEEVFQLINPIISLK